MQKWEKFTKEELEEIIKTSTKYSEVLEKLGYATYSANNKHVKNICKKYGFSLEHFSGTTLKNLTGQVFERLTVIERDLSKPRGHYEKVYWICQCECGNKISVAGKNLVSGNTKSCGCFQKEQSAKAHKLNLAGERYGKLLVLEEVPSIVEKSGQIRTAWRCRCDCGNAVIVKTINLRAGDTQSCGCLFSKGEARIETLLKEMNISFKKEYSFNDLLTDKNYPMRFDFAVFNGKKIECLIEYQGRQHYMEWDTKVETTLEERQKRDEQKKLYCLKNNIKLIEIPYTDYSKIDCDYLKEKIYEYNN